MLGGGVGVHHSGPGAGPVACLALSTVVDTHAHTIKHPGVALAVPHQVQALPRRGLFDMALSPWVSGGSRIAPAMRFIAGCC